MHTMNNILVLSSLIEMFIIMFIFCYNIGMPPPTLGERVCVHVCWHYVCMCVRDSGEEGYFPSTCLSAVQPE